MNLQGFLENFKTFEYQILKQENLRTFMVQEDYMSPDSMCSKTVSVVQITRPY